MGFQTYACKYCKNGFYWCSVGGFSSGGEHAKDCPVLTDDINSEDWVVHESV